MTLPSLCLTGFGEVPLAFEFGSVFSLNLPATPVLLTSNEHLLAYLPDWLVADYHVTERLAILRLSFQAPLPGSLAIGDRSLEISSKDSHCER